MTRLLTKTGEWCDGSDGRDYLVNSYTELDWSLSDDNTLHCQRLNTYFETQGLPVAQTGLNSFKIVSTGIELFRNEYSSYSQEQRSTMTRLSRILLSR